MRPQEKMHDVEFYIHVFGTPPGAGGDAAESPTTGS